MNILKDEIFFVGEDHRHFGFINKENGRVTRISKLGEGERIIDETKKESLLILKNKVILDYNVTAKKGIKDKRMHHADIDDIKQFIRVEGGILILTDRDLRLYE